MGARGHLPSSEVLRMRTPWETHNHTATEKCDPSKRCKTLAQNEAFLLFKYMCILCARHADAHKMIYLSKCFM